MRISINSLSKTWGLKRLQPHSQLILILFKEYLVINTKYGTIKMHRTINDDSYKYAKEFIKLVKESIGETP